MSYKNTLEVLHAQAKEIMEITGELKNTETIRTIDIHRLLDKLRDIYDLTLDLQSITQVSGYIKNEPANADMHSQNTDIPFEVEESRVEAERKTEPEVDTKTLVEEQNDMQGATAELEEKIHTNRQEKSVTDRHHVTDKIVNEQISPKSDRDDITAHYKTTPISSITSGMGLNDKFELINELFDGNKEAFDKAVGNLNNAASFVEAYNYLEKNFNWDMDSQYVQRLLELIRRKLIIRRNEQ